MYYIYFYLAYFADEIIDLTPYFECNTDKENQDVKQTNDETDG